jgi:hypothetical protein
LYEGDLYWTQISTGFRPKTKICWMLIVIEITKVDKLHCWCIFVNFSFFPLFSHKNIKHFSFSHAELILKKVVRIFCDLYWTSIKSTSVHPEQGLMYGYCRSKLFENNYESFIYCFSLKIFRQK